MLDFIKELTKFNIIDTKTYIGDVTNTCCFTGHRPQTIPYLYNDKSLDYIKLKNNLNKMINDNVQNYGTQTFITGMALGIDVIAAKIIIDLKKSLSLRLVAAIPFVNQYKRWNNESIDNYFNILAKCDIIVLCNREYTNTCLLDRNKWMVDNSSRIIAVYNGSGIGGTAHCVNYALRMKKKVDIIRP